MTMIGKYVLVRTYSAGVHFGFLKSQNGKEVVLTDARRLWQWEGAFTLSAVAENGISGGRISTPVSEILLTEAIEVIPTSHTAQTQLAEFKTHGSK